MLYSSLLIFHNFFRWVILLLLVLAIIKMAKGVFTKSEWQASDLKALRRFALFLTIQFILGVFLFFLPNGLVQISLNHQEMAVIVKNATIRFFVMEHPSMMIFAVAIAHITSVVVRKLKSDRKKFIFGLGLLVLNAVIIFSFIPWPYKEFARPLFRFF